MDPSRNLWQIVHNVLLADDFNSRYLENLSAACELKRLNAENESFSFSKENGWHQSSVKVHLPAEKVMNPSEADAPEFEVGSIYHRSLIKVIKTTFQDISVKAYHFTPFHLFWKSSPDETPKHVITELYNSDAFLGEHENIQKQPREPGCELKTATSLHFGSTLKRYIIFLV
jgi:hypothetical protein